MKNVKSQDDIKQILIDAGVEKMKFSVMSEGMFSYSSVVGLIRYDVTLCGDDCTFYDESDVTELFDNNITMTYMQVWTINNKSKPVYKAQYLYNNRMCAAMEYIESNKMAKTEFSKNIDFWKVVLDIGNYGSLDELGKFCRSELEKGMTKGILDISQSEINGFKTD